MDKPAAGLRNAGRDKLLLTIEGVKVVPPETAPLGAASSGFGTQTVADGLTPEFEARFREGLGGRATEEHLRIGTEGHEGKGFGRFGVLKPERSEKTSAEDFRNRKMEIQRRWVNMDIGKPAVQAPRDPGPPRGLQRQTDRG